jgi:hypothetical protein
MANQIISNRDKISNAINFIFIIAINHLKINYYPNYEEKNFKLEVAFVI